jgi:hypothetical protein
MSTAPGVHSYFRRSFDGNVPMTPSEIRDQILAVRDAILEPVIGYPAGGMFSPSPHWISCSISIVFSLKNVGRALCRNPFLRVKPDCDLNSYTATYDGALEAWKTMFPYGTLIHVDDQQTCLALNFNACVYADVLGAHFYKGDSDLTETVFIFPGCPNHQVETISDKTSLRGIDFHLRYGAENAPVTEQTITYSRKELAKGSYRNPACGTCIFKTTVTGRVIWLTLSELRKSAPTPPATTFRRHAGGDHRLTDFLASPNKLGLSLAPRH